MKKVLVLAAAATLFATQALAAGNITGTKHDLSTTNGGTYGTDEICVFCHTPHGAATNATKYVPLWNRTAAVDPTGYYTSTTLDHVPGSSAESDAYLCLSCHDGTTQLSALMNPPNSGFTTQPTVVTGAAALGTDLSNDHPINFVYDAALDLKPHGATELVANAGGLPLFGAAQNEMWCSTCHDVHDNANSPFLRASNDQSGLCKTCHLK